MTPTLVSPFLGAGADWLCNLGEDLVPPVSWMGGKRKIAPTTLALLGLRPSRPVPAILGDASWWGWVWPTLLDEVTGPEVSAMLRFWRDRDPRELWFWLREVGPMESRAEAAAQLLWLQARAASGVPVWWEGAEVLAAPGKNRTKQYAHDRGANGLKKWDRTQTGHVGPANQTHASLVQWASTKIDAAGQRQATETRNANANGYIGGGGALLASDGRGDPRESGQRTTRDERLVANTRGGQVPGALFEAGHKGTDERGGGGGIIDTGTIARRIDTIRHRLVKGSGGAAGFGYDHETRRAAGWRSFETTDVAQRLDTIRRRNVHDVVIVHADAEDLTNEWASILGADARVSLDPPYEGKTGYPAECPRPKVLRIAETWARHGAPTVLHEAVGLVPELGPGWKQVQLRGGAKEEWVTCWGCDMQAIVPALLRAIA